jgi:hypothetical protein
LSNYSNGRIPVNISIKDDFQNNRFSLTIPFVITANIRQGDNINMPEPTFTVLLSRAMIQRNIEGDISKNGTVEKSAHCFSSYKTFECFFLLVEAEPKPDFMNSSARLMNSRMWK